jgi:predicted ATP-dependent serine protease
MWVSKLLRSAARLSQSGRFAATRHVQSLSALAPSQAFFQSVANPSRSFATSSDGFRCQSCGQTFAKWQGQCSSCSEWGSVEATTPAEPLFRQSNAASFTKAKPKRAVAWSRTVRGAFEQDAPHALRMNDVELDTFVERIELPDRELVGRRARYY